MGELTHMVDEGFKKNNSSIPWYAMYGLRNRIVHDYEGVNLSLVWEIIKGDIPELKKKLEAI